MHCLPTSFKKKTSDADAESEPQSQPKGASAVMPGLQSVAVECSWQSHEPAFDWLAGKSELVERLRAEVMRLSGSAVVELQYVLH